MAASVPGQMDGGGAGSAPGPITQQIQQTYFAAVRGEVDRYKDWLDYVE